MSEIKKIEKIPILPLKDVVIFPSIIIPLFVGRIKSVRALEYCSSNNIEIFMTTQKKTNDAIFSKEDIYKVGVFATISQYVKLQDGSIKIIIEGTRRGKILNLFDSKSYFEVEAVELKEPSTDKAQTEVFRSMLQKQLLVFTRKTKHLTEDNINNFFNNEENNVNTIINNVVNLLNLSIQEKQDFLQENDLEKKLINLLSHLKTVIEISESEKRISNRVKAQMEKSHKEYYLNEQIKAIQKELGDDASQLTDELQKKIKNAGLSTEAKEKATAELKKLKSMTVMSAEATVVRSYLDWLVSLPWSSRSAVKKNLNEAEDILNNDHYGLENVKKRILEFLAVQKRADKANGSILCFVGPPGIGKTSLASSIARATGRKFAKISLGGIRDETEIRGHRRTYIGSMPGKIIQSMKKVGKNNPLLLLDEIDKMSFDFRGDPSSALLEALDPEQNSNFNDHYIEVDYDLSDVFFIATANSLDMPKPLLDRMEIIKLSSYTDLEKLAISKEHFIPKIRKNLKLSLDQFELDDISILEVIKHYTKEAGVRSCERTITSLARKIVLELEKNKSKIPAKITKDNLQKFLGPIIYKKEIANKQKKPGIATGMAWTELGGEILFIETAMSFGKGKIHITGNIKEVMKESINLSLSFIKSKANYYNINPKVLEENDIYIHIPEAATPKDGPSAGITIFSTLISLLKNIPINNFIAMTGELSLQGNVLAIGGLKEKLLAAVGANIKKVIIPKDNEKDIEDMPKEIKDNLEIITISHVDELLIHIFDNFKEFKGSAFNNNLINNKNPNKEIQKYS